MPGAAILQITPKTNAAGGAAVGLILLGPLGALLGAANSSSNQSATGYKCGSTGRAGSSHQPANRASLSDHSHKRAIAHPRLAAITRTTRAARVPLRLEHGRTA
ncbi:hypothetical protein GCM10010449_05610 [Streptomyces rectiviolaceus]|uniref:Uncharacterized protein n=1 Tax=Streptomyces rectiviolaceus TaxID=332591 RepID=A0ABP6M716_9ACTN